MVGEVGVAGIVGPVSFPAGMPAENAATIGPSSPSTRTSRYSINVSMEAPSMTA